MCLLQKSLSDPKTGFVFKRDVAIKGTYQSWPSQPASTLRPYFSVRLQHFHAKGNCDWVSKRHTNSFLMGVGED